MFLKLDLDNTIFVLKDIPALDSSYTYSFDLSRDAESSSIPLGRVLKCLALF